MLHTSDFFFSHIVFKKMSVVDALNEYLWRKGLKSHATDN